MGSSRNTSMSSLDRFPILRTDGETLVLMPRQKVFRVQNSRSLEGILSTNLRVSVPACKRKRIITKGAVATPYQNGFILDLVKNGSAAILAATLTKESGIPWMVMVLEAWEARSEEGGNLVLILDQQESLARSEVIEKILTTAHLLWIGETTSGVQIGPILRNTGDYKEYLQCTWDSSSLRKIFELGFSPFLPLSSFGESTENLEVMAHDITYFLHSRDFGDVFLPARNRFFDLTGTLGRSQRSLGSILRSQCWDKGILRGLTVVEDAEMGIYISVARSPCAGVSYLESNSGKGFRRKDAVVTLVGEAVERFVAYQSQFTVQDDQPNSQGKTSHEIFPLGSFHPYGSCYLPDQFDRSGFMEAEDLTSGVSVKVPRDLIFFPVLGERCTIGTSTGLAAHTEEKLAIKNGLGEILERDNFYPNFLAKIPGTRFLAEMVAKHSTRSMARVLSRMEMRGFIAEFFTYNPESSILPIVHCLLIHPSSGIASRGSGSASTYAQASGKALLEAVQIFQQQKKEMRKDPSAQDRTYQAWRRKDVLQELRCYMTTFKVGHSFPEEKSDLQLEDLLERMRRQKRKVLVYRFPALVMGWSVVRVLVPESVCHQVPSESAGGRRLKSIRFRHGVPV